MPNSNNMPFNFAMNVNTQDETTWEVLQKQRDGGFSIATMGNFSCNAQNGKLSDRNFIEIDRYNFDEILAQEQSEAPEQRPQSTNIEPSPVESGASLLDSIII